MATDIYESWSLLPSAPNQPLKYSIIAAAVLRDTLFVLSDDNTLRIYNVSENGSNGGSSGPRPRCELIDTISKFTLNIKDTTKKGSSFSSATNNGTVPLSNPLRSLHAVPGWNCLTVLHDQWGILFYSLVPSSSSSGYGNCTTINSKNLPFILPNTKGALSIEPLPSGNMLIVTFPNGVRIYEYRSSVKNDEEETNKTSEAHDFSIQNFHLYGEHYIFMNDYSNDSTIGNDSKSSSSRPSTSSSLSSTKSASSSSAVPGAAPSTTDYSSPHAYGRIVRVTWSNPLICLSIVRRRDIPLNNGNGLLSSSSSSSATKARSVSRLSMNEPSDTNNYGNNGWNDNVEEIYLYNAQDVPASLDTNYELVYVFLHAYTGQVMRRIIAGLAPSLDPVTGLLTVPYVTNSNHSTGNDPNTNDILHNPRHQINQAFMKSVGLQSLLVPPPSSASNKSSSSSKSNPGNRFVTVPWGMTAFIADRNDIINDNEDDDIDVGSTENRLVNDTNDYDPEYEPGLQDSMDGRGNFSSSLSSSQDSLQFDLPNHAPLTNLRSFAGRNDHREETLCIPQEDDKFITQLRQYIETQETNPSPATVTVGPNRRTVSSGHSRNTGCIALPIVKEGVAIRGYAPDGSSFTVGEPEMHTEILIHRSNGKSIHPYLSSVEHANDKFSIPSVPSFLYTSPCFPYMLATFPQNIQVYNTRTCSATQTIKFTGTIGITSCMEEVQVKQKLLAGKYHATDNDTENSVLQRILSQPERVYLISSTGITCLRMVPAMVQIAGLLSRRPPQFEAALALCDTFHMIRQRLAVNSSDNSVGPSTGLGSDTNDTTDIDSTEAATPAWALTLGGVSETKIKQIRAHFGYSLFAAGDFATALLHLAEAHEPVYRILGLFPQMGLSTKTSAVNTKENDTTVSASPGNGTNYPRLEDQLSTVSPSEYPIKMPILIDSLLPIALPPFLYYLLLQRKHCLHALAKDNANDSHPTNPNVPPSATTSTISSSPRGLITLIDTYIITTCLWLERYLYRFTTSTGSDIAQSLSFTNALTSSPTSSLTHRTVARSQLRIIRKLLKYILSTSSYLSMTDAELLLQSFGKTNDAYMVALYYGQRSHEKALRILASVTEATIRTGVSFGYPICSTWFTIEDLSRSEPILSAIVALSTYLTNLDKTYAVLVRKFLVPFVDGGAGISGVLIGLAILLQSPCFLQRKTGEQFDIPQMLYTLLEIIDRCTYRTDHPQLWTLTGTKLYPALRQEGNGESSGSSAYADRNTGKTNDDVYPVVSVPPPYPRSTTKRTAATVPLFRRLLTCFLKVPSQSMDDNHTMTKDGTNTTAAAASSSENNYLDSFEHINNLQNEISVLNPPQQGWSRHYAIVLYEYIFTRYTPQDKDNYHSRTMNSSSNSSNDNTNNTNVSMYLHQLIQLYLNTIADICNQLSYIPQKRITEDTGLVREYRERMYTFLRYSPWNTYINASFILSEFEMYRTNESSPLYLYEEQALLLQRLGKHAEALRIYIHDIGDFTLAEEYCAMVYNEQSKESGTGISAHFQNSAYIDLLRAYVHDHTIRSSLIEKKGTDTNGTGTESIAVGPTTAASAYVLKRHTNNGTEPTTNLPTISTLDNDHASTSGTENSTVDPAEQILQALRGLGTKSSVRTTNGTTSSASLPYLDTSVTPLIASFNSTEGTDDSSEILSSDASTSSTVNGIMDILSRNFNRINPTEALPLLPDNVPLSILTPFLTSTMRYNMDHKRMLHSTKALTTYYTTNIRADLVRRQARSVMIEKTSVCGKCARKLIIPGRNAPSALGIYPNGQVVHSTCIDSNDDKDKNITIVTTVDDGTDPDTTKNNESTGIETVNFTSRDDDDDITIRNTNDKAPVTRTNRNRGKGNNKYESTKDETIVNTNNDGEDGVRLVTF